MTRKNPLQRVAAIVFISLIGLALNGCSDDDSTDPAPEDAAGVVDDGAAPDSDNGAPENDGSVPDSDAQAPDSDADTPDTDGSVAIPGVNFANFLAGSISGDVAQIDCTLTDGSQSRCYQFEVIGEPLDHPTGPYCPRNITDGPEVTGKWLDNGELVDLTGEYVANLEQRYGPGWLLHDEQTGVVNVTVTPESCLAAAQLNPPQQWWNYCIECTIEGVGGPVPMQVTIPIVPVPRTVIAELGNTFPGVSLNGIGLSFPADIDGILATFNIAALDDCGGHVNNAISYHYHGATGCWHEISQSDGHAALIGYAMDGYGIYSMTNPNGIEPTDLDDCRGHTDTTRGYHYHAASAGENMFIGCFRGEVAQVAGGGGRPAGPPPR